LPNPIPSVLAILICDRVIQEAGTAKKTLVGIFERVKTSGLPATFAFGIYGRLIDAEGEYGLRVRLCKTDSEGNERVLFELKSTATVESRLIPVDIAINFPTVKMDEYGRYEVQIYADDMYLGHASLDIESLEGGQ
jgi:hypothetical protein